MNDAINTTYGSCIELELEFKDESGAPEDVTDDEFAILQASRAVFDSAIFTKIDPAAGKVRFFLAAEDAAKLSRGLTNWFRIRRTLPGGCEDNSTPIWVNVK